MAYDPRPIFGGQVVIQAKGYKHTVGVSAVRDLSGTMQNEGASKGILVTTSGYGKASFEFADGKPLELLAGSNLLYLLEKHAGITAKIEPPEDWTDPMELRPLAPRDAVPHVASQGPVSVAFAALGGVGGADCTYAELTSSSAWPSAIACCHRGASAAVSGRRRPSC